MAGGSRRTRRVIDVWPGYVDILAALLILVIFVLLLFSLAQFLMTRLLDAQETELDVMYNRVVELTDLLGLEQERSARLQRETVELGQRVDDLGAINTGLREDVALLEADNEAQRDEVARQLRLVGSLQEDIDALRRLRASLEGEVGRLAAELGNSTVLLGAARDRSKALAAELADAEERTLLAQREVDQRDIRIQALSALVDQRGEALQAERVLRADARAEVALLNDKLGHLTRQLDEIRTALEAAERDKAAQTAQISDLGERLNVALAREVNRLRAYQSDFFGSLRQALGDNPAIRVVGDRFVLPSELLFDSGSAELGAPGRAELAKLVDIVDGLSTQIPNDVAWILRIDGHTDRLPINNAQFTSNWELSTARAVSVVRYLVEQGIAPQRLSAAGFGEFHPVDPADTGEAYRRNRRIELKLTSR
jgi:chemotaxis protein MotB